MPDWRAACEYHESRSHRPCSQADSLHRDGLWRARVSWPVLIFAHARRCLRNSANTAGRGVSGLPLLRSSHVRHLAQTRVPRLVVVLATACQQHLRGQQEQFPRARCGGEVACIRSCIVSLCQRRKMLTRATCAAAHMKGRTSCNAGTGCCSFAVDSPHASLTILRRVCQPAQSQGRPAPRLQLEKWGPCRWPAGLDPHGASGGGVGQA